LQKLSGVTGTRTGTRFLGTHQIAKQMKDSGQAPAGLTGYRRFFRTTSLLYTPCRLSLPLGAFFV
jgi:hypothetical protein